MSNTNIGAGNGRQGGATRVVALVGPYSSGKTALLESMLHACGAITRKGTAEAANRTGDSSAEARARKMGVEINVACAEFMDDSWAFLDCPGSIEFQYDTQAALMVCDAAVVVCDPDPARATALAPLLHQLEALRVPHMLFVNKIDTAHRRIAELMAALQHISARKLVLRQVPIRQCGADGAETVAGYVDLVSERAYRYKQGEASDLIEIPSDIKQRENEARRELLESLADFDDALLEKLLEDVVPEKTAIYKDLHEELAADQIVPVLIGAAAQDHGVRRLLKALRHDVPSVAQTLKRRGTAQGTAVEIFKTLNLAHTGKMSLARVWSGEVKEGDVIDGQRIGGALRPFGLQFSKAGKARAGDVAALAKMDRAATGDALGARLSPWGERPTSVFELAIHARNRADEVKLSTALAKLAEEDPSLMVEAREETHELVLRGQGEIHLHVTIEKLAGRYGVPVEKSVPRVAYRETIRKGAKQHGRYKRQTGGHGQFGDVHLEISPLPAGTGIKFTERIVGGVVPRQYIPGVEAGVREWMAKGTLGFPVVDVGVTLYDGTYHNVDSSDQAFRMAAKLALGEAMPLCQPVLLEPIVHVTVFAPSEFTAKLQRIVTTRRGQLLGYNARAGWTGWDEVKALMPASDIHDLIVEIRSLTFGVGSFRAQFDHLQELVGKMAEKVIETHRAKAA